MSDGADTGGLRLVARKVSAVLTLAGFSPKSVGQFDEETGVEVHLDPDDGPEGALWVRWRSSAALREAGQAKFRERRAAGGAFDPAFITGHPLTRFDNAASAGIGEALCELLKAAGFEAAFGQNSYAPYDVQVTGYTENDVTALADELT
jgi:hypothetical protein